jgi:hypothetical protein
MYPGQSAPWQKPHAHRASKHKKQLKVELLIERNGGLRSVSLLAREDRNDRSE